MSAARWVGVLAMAAVLVAAACGSARSVARATASAVAPGAVAPTPTTTASAPTPTPTPLVCPPDVCLPVASEARTNCPDVQSAPQFPPTLPSSRNLALVWLQGSQSFVVRDVTDLNHPFTVSTLPHLSRPQFVSATELSGSDDTELVRMPLAGSPTTVVARFCLGVIGFGWSPDGTQAAYVTDVQSSAQSQLHIVGGGVDRVVASMPPFPWGTGCEGPVCDANIDARLSYSPSGAYISLVQNWSGPNMYVWTADGKLITSVDSTSRDNWLAPTMSVWSGGALYFRDGKGVETWRNRVESLLLAGVTWIRPKASPAGGQIVYEARDASGVPSVFMLDTGSGNTRLVAKDRSEPAFLTSRYLWFKGERACVAGDGYPCSAGASSIPTAKTYIYDLQTGIEAESIITAVWDVWPHPA